MFFAPAIWLRLVLMDKLPDRRPYLSLWLGGWIFWLLAVHWTRLPHPLNYLGWVALAAYLGVYLPVTIGLTRVATHRLGAPLWLAAPVVWTGMDWLRGHLLTGFLMASPAHALVDWNLFIQFADCWGEYGVTAMIILVAACLAEVAASQNDSETTPRAGLKKLIPAAQRVVKPISRPIAAYSSPNVTTQATSL